MNDVSDRYRVVSILGTTENEVIAENLQSALNGLADQGYEPLRPRDWVRNGHHLLVIAQRQES